MVGPKVRTWIPCSAPPPAPEVLYVVPTFGWVRSGDAASKSSWRRGGGLRVYLNRPWNVSGYGEMLGVVLPTASVHRRSERQARRAPLKNFVTQWGNDPIWLSPFVPGVAPTRANFPLARTTPDPDGKWLPSFAPTEGGGSAAGTVSDDGARASRIAQSDRAIRRRYRAARCIFRRRAPALVLRHRGHLGRGVFSRSSGSRWRVTSRSRSRAAHLSNVVLADFMPLVPDRWLNVTQTRDPQTRHVNVFGNTFTDSSSHKEAGARRLKSLRLVPAARFIDIRGAAVAPSSVVDVWVERFNPALGEDFGWHRELGAHGPAKYTPQPLRPRRSGKNDACEAHPRARPTCGSSASSQR